MATSRYTLARHDPELHDGGLLARAAAEAAVGGELVKRRTYEIEAEIDGQIHRGKRIVAHDLWQGVRFEALRQRDAKD